MIFLGELVGGLAVGFLAMDGLLHLIGELLRKNTPPAQAACAGAHQHAAKIVGVQHEQRQGQNLTIVLAICECMDPQTVSTRYLYGHWELGEFHNGLDRDLAGLQRMTGIGQAQGP
jgi:hypothetical protein